MKSIGNGGIEFESRYQDIEPLMDILDQWMKEHPDDEKKEVAEKLYGILKVMYIGW